MALAALANAATEQPAKVSAETLTKMMPDQNCDGKSDECRTPAQAAPFIEKSMARYRINNTNEIAAIVSLMALESVNFTFKHNVSPGRRGQGTANMQMAEFNLEYAKSIPCLQGKVANITTVNNATNATLDYILSLVTVDKYNFGSAAWFYTTKCLPDSRTDLQRNITEGFATYMKCVGVNPAGERTTFLKRAMAAFGLS
ncbi:hypothetical protein E5D57_002409 [Metarhizium anisopliae]|nr:hypothetical protein E5D57_002409 [Metarhizium anisopliae]